MKTKSLLFTVIILFSFCSISLYGQNKVQSKQKSIGPPFGIGVSLFNPINLYRSDEPISNIYLTFNIKESFRIEPKVSFVVAQNLREYNVGVGLFAIKSLTKYNLLCGIRVGYGSNEITIVAPTVGGEYFFINNFSLGCEVQIQGLISNENEFEVFTSSAVLVRFYF